MITQQGQYALEQVIHLALKYAALKSGNLISWIDRDYAAFYEQFNMMTVRQLQVRNDLCLIYKIVNGTCNNTQAGDLFTRWVEHYMEHGV